ncbi:MAG: hypothetical protein EBE86_001835 [Hormoscilla sp. GUM202]|nr:hypothetical protein [Hormoscilla sp. GUM202]
MLERKSLQPLDRVAIALMTTLSIVIVILLMNGVYTAARVRNFSWQDKTVSAEDTAFILTFNRPMDRESVENNMKIEPPLPGKISWAGRKMAYTLTNPVPYGTSFNLQLLGAKDRLIGQEKTVANQPFMGKFKSRDRAFAYIGVDGEEAGRLVLYNLTKQSKEILTPEKLVVMDFQPYPSRDQILFAASDRLDADQGFLEQKLYTATTGITPASSRQKDKQRQAEAGIIETVLDNQDYRNLKFDLSPDGQTIVVQRINRRNSGDVSLWVVRPGTKPQPLNSKPGGEFTITPDSRAIAMTQGQGIAILPLDPDLEVVSRDAHPVARLSGSDMGGRSRSVDGLKNRTREVQPIDFLPNFGMVLDFASDGSAVMVRFNPDYTRSLFLLTNSEPKKLLDTTGSISSCQFDPSKTILYCLLSQLVQSDEIYQELPYFAAIDLKTGNQIPLLALPTDRRDMHFSLSPDGLALLFDQTITNPNAAQAIGQNQGPNSSSLWLLPLVNIAPQEGQQLQPQELPWRGFRPRWLP